MRQIILLLTLLTVYSANIKSQNQKLFILGGELSNSAATSVEDIDNVIPRMATLSLNTLLVPAYWELLEPQEGQYNFTLIDRTILRARENQLKIIFLWFGAWKNSMSCYAPLWVKNNTRRFPRAHTIEGKPLEIASPFSQEVYNAECQAFSELIKHIATTAPDIVTMVQIENEIGMLESARDHSPLAETAYKKGVPKNLLTYLHNNKETLHPWLKARTAPYYNQQTHNTNPTWTEVFGNDIYTDEIFMAYYYACYVGKLAKKAHSILNIPLYVNAAMNSRGRMPGQYPSAGPLAHLIDIWHAAAPNIALLAPDIYDSGFKTWAQQYALHNNTLFIPESHCCENSGVRALYVFGEHQAIGFSTFAIDQASASDTKNINEAYRLLRQLKRGTK